MPSSNGEFDGIELLSSVTQPIPMGKLIDLARSKRGHPLVELSESGDLVELRLGDSSDRNLGRCDAKVIRNIEPNVVVRTTRRRNLPDQGHVQGLGSHPRWVEYVEGPLAVVVAVNEDLPRIATENRLTNQARLTTILVTEQQDHDFGHILR